MKLKEDFFNALKKEISLRKNYLDSELVSTIYFGGGTPSLLSNNELQEILDSIRSSFDVSADVEITLEANPDDLNTAKTDELNTLGVNRLSIGIQSFNNEVLNGLNRVHSAEEAVASIKTSQDSGINNITIDLIYGIPGKHESIWQDDISSALELDVPHISAYCLTIEPQTAFGMWHEKGSFHPVSDEFAAKQFQYLMKSLTQAGYEQYEISNFCLPGFYSKHNTAYWQNKKYLGLGPSAHSFDGDNRSFNVANNAKYISALKNDVIPQEVEKLSDIDKINEYLLTTIRTKWGTDLNYIEQIIPDWLNRNISQITRLKESNHLLIEDDKILLTEEGKLLADEITLQLFLER